MSKCDYQFYANYEGPCPNDATLFYLGDMTLQVRDRCQVHSMGDAINNVQVFRNREARDLELLRRSL